MAGDVPDNFELVINGRHHRICIYLDHAPAVPDTLTSVSFSLDHVLRICITSDHALSSVSLAAFVSFEHVVPPHLYHF